ncbi:hypothetical protein C1E23_07775 [Pseudoalteromonas phenolica]|uniref:Uncharacterized protein n=1 Tax=Pseudoalteromonas phenolica TaxID=161398 RepID=A0A4Q7IQK3_9GAMM|nr:hypothetical protein [Pseudoalteromonas phenolica]RZQ53756.1 hypothetical protein C1E23_07775 [Pseudoalteromonas phenolica]
MSKYKPGETSEAVTIKKNSITKSILKKAELIDAISSIENIYITLNINGDSISESAVHKWKDKELGIIAYSWNTARAEHNSNPLKLLQNAIANANRRLAGKQKESNKRRQHQSSDNATIQLRKENEELKIALAEVYRAYMQLVESYREDQLIDDAIRQLILEQARIFGQHRIWEVK